MKFVNLIAGVALAVAPTLVAAESATKASVESGGISQSGPLPIYDDDDDIPAGAIIVGGLVILGGAVVGIIAATDSGTPAVSTTSTTAAPSPE